jgi:hypothetical protein
MTDPESRRRLGELLDPFTKAPPGQVEDRRSEPGWMKPPYLGTLDLAPSLEYYLSNEVARRTQPPSPLAVQGGIRDISEPPPLTMEDMLGMLSLAPGIRGPK